MDIFSIGVALGAGLIVLLILRNRRSHSDQAGFYHTQDGSIPPDGHVAASGQHGRESHNPGDWGGRDMSHDHHDSGGGGDWGEDAGGGGGGGDS